MHWRDLNGPRNWKSIRSEKFKNKMWSQEKDILLMINP